MFNHRVIFIIVILLLLAMLIIPAVYNLFSDDCADTPGVITMCEYRQIKDGMTVIEVEAIAGFYGAMIKQAGDKVTYIWENSDDSNMTCVFLNGKLIDKSRKGLD